METGLYYITLASNGVGLGNNTASKFTNVFQFPISFPNPEKWRVALSSIQFENGLRQSAERPSITLDVKCSILSPRYNKDKILSTHTFKLHDRFHHFEPSHLLFQQFLQKELQSIQISIVDQDGKHPNLGLVQPTILTLIFKRMSSYQESKSFVINFRSTDTHNGRFEANSAYDFSSSLSAELSEELSEEDIDYEIGLASITYLPQFSPLGYPLPKKQTGETFINFGLSLSQQTGAKVLQDFVFLYAGVIQHSVDLVVTSEDFKTKQTIIDMMDRAFKLLNQKIGNLELKPLRSMIVDERYMLVNENEVSFNVFIPPSLGLLLGFESLSHQQVVFREKGGNQNWRVSGTNYATRTRESSMIVTVFGGKGILQSSNKIEPDANIPNTLFLYTSFSEKIVVGQQSLALLQTVPVLQKDITSKSASTWEPKNIQFHRITLRDLSQLTFQVRQVNGDFAGLMAKDGVQPFVILSCIIRPRI